MKLPLTLIKTSVKNIQENKDIILKEADKGSTEVILNKISYRTKIHNKLRAETNYHLIDTNIISKITKFCRTHNKTLEKKTILNYLHPKS